MKESIRSRYVDVAGRPLHVADFGGDGPPVVLVHGLGGSHVNWISVAGRLTSHGHVTAPDLPGFGLSVPAGQSCSVEAAGEVLEAYLRSLGEPALVVANSMGAVAAIEAATSSPSTVRGMVLLSPAVPFDPRTGLDRQIAFLFSLYFLPRADRLIMEGRRRVQRQEDIARFTLDLCTARTSRIDPQVIQAHIDFAVRRSRLPGIDRGFVEAARSLLVLLARRAAYDRMVASVVAPTLVIHGRDDRLVKPEWVRRVADLRPDWSLVLLDDVGHVPMLEVPATTSAIIGEWVAHAAAA